MPIPERKVRDLIKAWKKVRGDKLSYGKAEKRLQRAVDLGCPLEDSCVDCEKKAYCPILDPDNDEEG